MVVKEDGIYYFLVKYRDNKEAKNQEVARLPLEIIVKKQVKKLN